MIRYLLPLFILAGCVVLYGCAVGPDYKRPEVEVPAAYKGSTAADWKPAEPRDAVPRGMWWKMYGDPELDALMARVDAANQTIAAAEAQVRISAAIADQARAGFWPLVTGTIQRTESQPSSTTGPIVGQTSSRRTIYSLPINFSWEADLWGRIRRLVESGDATTQASASDLIAARLLAQTTLAQNYFEARALDSQKQLLDQTAAAYETSLEMTRNRYNAGIISRLDVVQAETTLNATRAKSLDVGVRRAQLENAIAVLVGRPASGFSLAQGPLAAASPLVPPAGLPAELLERRPDVAAAERRVESANAEIGVAKAAYFPAATLSGTYGWQSAQRARWFTAPSNFWSLGVALALTLFDGGRRAAVTEQAQATYDQTVAKYRGTVLQAFTDVEDNLAALRILEQEGAIQDETVRAAQQALDITLNQYKSGITTYLQVVVTQATMLQAQTTALDIRQRRMAASVLLVKALGGGWEEKP